MAGSSRDHADDLTRGDRDGDVTYDSYLVRTWRRDGRTSFARVELRHIQAEESATATNVDLAWLASSLARLIGSPHDPPPE